MIDERLRRCSDKLPIGEVIKEATRDLFGFLGTFDEHWDDGWRPVLTDYDDISFRSGLGSYVRSCKDENGHRFAFRFIWGQLLLTTLSSDIAALHDKILMNNKEFSRVGV